MTGQPDNKVINAASEKIELLTIKVAQLTEASRHITSEQRRWFGESLPKIVRLESFASTKPDYYGVRITYSSTLEAHNYTEELGDLFGCHG